MHKIATCCYCGTRAALVLRGQGRHELSCAACGAPLHEMKAIPQPRAKSAPRPSCAGVARPGRPARKSKPPAPKPSRARHAEPEYGDRRRRKPRKPLLRKALEEIWDVVEDIFD
ncbi:hypothetical protein DC366_03130 [Pelagivirga sediminicola]|uniref:Uncharacterized protein n=1 Tax=Pelagivirga sediminicola TaxID=2170575 RepID=A0A2T7GBZ0_9RHOB|nr:hypothetical protein [Pelagivirga sediminicola]PVA11931.1 hypothetical protein DC366_03130 [Pelagivirga sediminicola]